MQHAAPHNGDFVTPTVVGAGEYDYAQRDLRYTRAMFQLLTADREFADYNKEILQRWLSTWTERSINAARKLQPLWSQSDARPRRFEDSMDTVEEPLRRHPRRPRPANPEGALALTADPEKEPEMTSFKTAESPFKSDNTASNRAA